MLGFTIIWIGQLISLLGTAMAGFALTIWAWDLTHQATALALVGFFTFAPSLLVTPFAGVLVDRWNRKYVMMLSDLAAVISTLAVLLLYSTGYLQFQFPAYSAAVTTMVSKKQYGRASGMLSTAQFASQIFAPALAAIFLSVIGIAGILTFDLITFLVAITALLLVHVPQPAVTDEGQKSRGSIWKESVYGFRYVYARKSLFALLLIFFCVNLLAPFAFTLLSPMILARTGDNEKVLGLVQSALGIGGLVGGIFLSIWGGPKRKIHGILIGLILTTLGIALIGLARDPIFWALATFFTIFFIPTINGSSQAIWQSRVAPDVQGRVFAARGIIAQIGAPVSMLLAGGLADSVFEPMMQPGGYGEPLFSWLVGSGLGAGMSLMFIIAGILGMIVGLGAYAIPIVRNVEDLLPEHTDVDPSAGTQV